MTQRGKSRSKQGKKRHPHPGPSFPPTLPTLDLPVCPLLALSLSGTWPSPGPRPPPPVAALVPVGPCAQRTLAGLCLHACTLMPPSLPSPLLPLGALLFVLHPPGSSSILRPRSLPQATSYTLHATRYTVPLRPPSAHLTSSPSSHLIPARPSPSQSFPLHPSHSHLVQAPRSSSQHILAHPSTSHATTPCALPRHAGYFTPV
jgi:hypothetical protein